MEDYIKTNQARLAHAYAHVIDFLRSKQIPYYEGSNAAFFIWAELRTVYLEHHGRSLNISIEDGLQVDEELYNKLIDDRVFISKGSAYGDELGGWFRIVFTHPDGYLDKGLERMWNVLKGSSTI